ncbi:hypothetical protein HanIR_Chr09g0431451 [Helianthus annuus]|nr:hypothetical protein HanIR_Chr09g0431451 [Helianthus annuus]
MMVFEWMDEWINISESMRCRRLTMLKIESRAKDCTGKIGHIV